MKTHLLILAAVLVIGCGPAGDPDAPAGAKGDGAVEKTAAAREGSGERAKEARAQLKELRTALELYDLTKGRYPEALEDLTKPAVAGEQAILVRIPDDPWGHAYVYLVEDGETAPSFRIYSLGPDGAGGTDDDILPPER